ncbi:MAG: Dyp-type peroxidase domain-containing protein [Alphaproteobacteria bacterium]
MTMPQPGILAPVPSHARYLEFGVVPDGDVVAVLRDLASHAAPETAVIGFGPGLVRGLGNSIAGLRPFPAMSGPHCQVPSTQADLWCWVRGDDRGRITHEARAITRMLEPVFRCDRIVDGFKFDRGLDLTGYEDGTENPEGEDAVNAAIVDGASFVAVQQWVHDLDHFNALPERRHCVVCLVKGQGFIAVMETSDNIEPDPGFVALATENGTLARSVLTGWSSERFLPPSIGAMFSWRARPPA